VGGERPDGASLPCGTLDTLALPVSRGMEEGADGWGECRAAYCRLGSIVLGLLRKRAINPLSPGPADAGGLGTVTLNLGSTALVGMGTGLLEVVSWLWRTPGEVGECRSRGYGVTSSPVGRWVGFLKVPRSFLKRLILVEPVC
jgi:hypothetical protein